jgi:hypothetical protein
MATEWLILAQRYSQKPAMGLYFATTIIDKTQQY